MKNKNLKKLISAVLALTMLTSMAMPVFAEEPTTTPAVTEETTATTTEENPLLQEIISKIDVENATYADICSLLDEYTSTVISNDLTFDEQMTLLDTINKCSQLSSVEQVKISTKYFMDFSDGVIIDETLPVGEVASDILDNIDIETSTYASLNQYLNDLKIARYTAEGFENPVIGITRAIGALSKNDRNIIKAKIQLCKNITKDEKMYLNSRGIQGTSFWLDDGAIVSSFGDVDSMTEIFHYKDGSLMNSYNGLYYIIVDNQAYITGYTDEIKSYLKDNGETLVVPNEIEGCPVTKICEWSFIEIDKYTIGIKNWVIPIAVAEEFTDGFRNGGWTMISQNKSTIENVLFVNDTNDYQEAMNKVNEKHTEVAEPEPNTKNIVTYFDGDEEDFFAFNSNAYNNHFELRNGYLYPWGYKTYSIFDFLEDISVPTTYSYSYCIFSGKPYEPIAIEPGDVNCDSSISVADVLVMVDKLTNNSSIAAKWMQTYDTNADGNFGVADIVKVAKSLVQ